MSAQFCSKLPHHTNVLQFVGASIFEDHNQRVEFAIVTAYKQHGNLLDYLKSNRDTMRDNQRLDFAHGIAKGKPNSFTS